MAKGSTTRLQSSDRRTTVEIVRDGRVVSTRRVRDGRSKVLDECYVFSPEDYVTELVQGYRAKGYTIESTSVAPPRREPSAQSAKGATGRSRRRLRRVEVVVTNDLLILARG